MKHPLAQNAGLIVTSPMVRTLQTAMGSLDWLMDKGIKIEADAGWQGACFGRLSKAEKGETRLKRQRGQRPGPLDLLRTAFAYIGWLPLFSPLDRLLPLPLSSLLHLHAIHHPGHIHAPRRRFVRARRADPVQRTRASPVTRGTPRRRRG